MRAPAYCLAREIASRTGSSVADVRVRTGPAAERGLDEQLAIRFARVYESGSREVAIASRTKNYVAT